MLKSGHPYIWAHYREPIIVNRLSIAFIPKSNYCETLLSLLNSDHFSILFSLSIQSSEDSHSSHRIYLYDQANFTEANRLLNSIPWHEILDRKNTEASWLIFKKLFLRIINRTVPSEIVHSPPVAGCPWINRSILQQIRQRYTLFKAARKSNSPSAWQAYKLYHNKIVSKIRRTKANFFHRLSFAKSSSMFWSNLKQLRKTPSQIPTLVHGNKYLSHTKLMLLTLSYILF